MYVARECVQPEPTLSVRTNFFASFCKLEGHRNSPATKKVISLINNFVNNFVSIRLFGAMPKILQLPSRIDLEYFVR